MPADNTYPCAHAPSLIPVATRYEFRPPEVFTGAARDHMRSYHHDAVIVEWRGGETWAVQRGSSSPQQVWSEKKRQWEWEPLPSSRTEHFLRRTRYPLDHALAIGARLAQEDA